MRWFVGSLGLALCTVIALNARVDPAGVRDAGVFELAHRQGPALVLASEKQFDQRAWVEAKSERCPEVLVTGSSTAGTLSQPMFAKRTLLNAWLTGPMMEDFEALVALLEARGCRPSLIVFGVDPFLFNAQINDQRWQSWQDYALEFSHPTNALERALGRIRRAFSVFEDSLAYETTRASLAELSRRQADSHAGPRLVSDLAAYCRSAATAPSLRYADGHFATCPRFELEEAQIDTLARSYLARNFHRMSTFASLDRGRLRRLQRVVERLHRPPTKVILFAPPYHPATFASIQRDARLRALLAELDRSLHALAQVAGASYVVLRNPTELGCGAESFADSHHTRPTCSARIAERVLAQADADARTSQR